MGRSSSQTKQSSHGSTSNCSMMQSGENPWDASLGMFPADDMELNVTICVLRSVLCAELNQPAVRRVKALFGGTGCESYLQR
jgi:hypothetical protein